MSLWTSPKAQWTKHYSQYKLGPIYCRKALKCGGICIYVLNEVDFTSINLLDHCKEQVLEIAALRINLNKKKYIIFCLYRAPTADLEYFFDHLESILQSLYNPKIHFILSGDFNINLLKSSQQKTQLVNFLKMHNVIGTVYFPTRITTTSATMIDNIFIDRNINYSIHPHINGLSDHDAQIVCWSI